MTNTEPMTNTERFAGKVVMVTGAASGIGKATATRFAREGASVACVDVNQEAAEGVAAELNADGASAIAVRCNVSDPADVRAAVDATVSDLDRPDVLCNIAGVGRFYLSTEMTPEQWQRIIDVNLTGTWLMSQAVLPHMLDRGGVIINTASTSGTTPQPYQAAYCASKGGVIMLTKALALEFWDRKLRVNAVSPGGVDTPMFAEFADLPDGADMKRLMRYMSPMGFCKPEDQASLYAYLASDEAHYMTGSIVRMDGGITL